MRYVRRGYFLLVLALALGASLSAQAQPVRTVTLPGPGYVQHLAHGRTIFHPREAVADRLLVVLQPGVSALSAGAPEALAAAGGGKLRHTLARGRVLVVDLPAGSDLQAAAARYRQLPQVAAPSRMASSIPAWFPTTRCTISNTTCR